MSYLDNKEKFTLLDNLFNLYLDSTYDKEDEIVLKSEGIDVEKIVQKNILLFRQLKTKSKAELNEIKFNRVKEFLTKLKAGIASGVEEYRKMANEIMTLPKFAELQPMFKNLKEVSEKDKQAILIDSKLLDILGEIEEEFNLKNKNE